MAGYVKLFGSILQSTIWEEPPTTRCVWITMLAMSDMDGVVSASVPGLARMAGVSRAETEAALTAFLAPDPDSRTKDFDGRRIEETDGGWRLLNHAKYRDSGRSVIDHGRSGVRSETNGRVYFIRCGDAIKIGFSQNPWARLAALRTGTPIDPVLLGHMAGTLADEHRIQKEFESSRKNREWFNETPELMAYIEANCDKGRQPGSYGSSTTETTDELPKLPLATTIRSEADQVLSLSSQSGSPGNPDQTRSRTYASAPRVFLGAKTMPFLRVFRAYPRRDKEQEAAQVFQELALGYPGGEEALATAIEAAFARGMLKRHPYSGPNATRPCFDRFLAGRRWEDPESEPDTPAGAPASRQASQPLPKLVGVPRPKFIPPPESPPIEAHGAVTR